MSEPKDAKLYKKVKAEIYKKYPKHSAYRSGLLVKEYKKQGGTYKGKKKSGKGLTRWFKEEWRNQRGGIGYKKKGDIYRPTIRVNKDSPATLKELTPKQLEKAKKEKKATGRVKKYKK